MILPNTHRINAAKKWAPRKPDREVRELHPDEEAKATTQIGRAAARRRRQTRRAAQAEATGPIRPAGAHRQRQRPTIAVQQGSALQDQTKGRTRSRAMRRRRAHLSSSATTAHRKELRDSLKKKHDQCKNTTNPSPPRHRQRRVEIHTTT